MLSLNAPPPDPYVPGELCFYVLRSYPAPRWRQPSRMTDLFPHPRQEQHPPRLKALLPGQPLLINKMAHPDGQPRFADNTGADRRYLKTKAFLIEWSG